MGIDTPQTIRLADYRPPDHLIDTVDLDIRLDPTATTVTARLAVSPNPDTEPAPLHLSGEELELQGIAVNGHSLDVGQYHVKDSVLTISNTPAEPFDLTIETIVDPSVNRTLSGLFLSNGVYCTQCEAEGFRRITFHPDRPDVLSVYTTRVEAGRDDVPVLLSNGNLVEEGPVDGTDRHYAIWHDPHPKPSYLFALVGGALAVNEGTFTTMGGHEVALRIYVEPGKEDRTAYAMDALKRSMRWDEEAFGRAYDLDVFMIVAVSDFNMGAMENKGLNIFNDKFILASPDTATDTDYENIEAIIAHEYFHNWTGNRITCRDWFQLCLKEGLTVFRDQEFTSDTRSRAVKRISDVRLLRAHQFPEDAGPLAHPVRPDSYIEINNFYTATVYEKGAEIIRLIKTVIGDDAFARGMTMYFDRHDGDAATVEDILACMADAAGRDLSDIMIWYTQAGTPRISVRADHDPQTGTLTIDLSQETPPTPGQPAKGPVPVPLRFGMIDGNGLPVPFQSDAPDVASGILDFPQARRTITFTGVSERPALSFNREFSAPITLDIDLSDQDRLTLMRHDSDPFNRWQADQDLANSLLLSLIESIAGRGDAPDTAAFARALASIISDKDLDPAFRAEVLRLPSEADLAREIGRDVDTEAIHIARSTLRQTLGRQLGDTLHDVFHEHFPTGPYSPDAGSAGRRALAHAAFDLRMAGTDTAAEEASALFERATNMTDTMAALSVLKNTDTKHRTHALDAFYDRFSEDPLVVDKWLALQAASSLPDTLERVRALTGHAAFTFDNPNRVRALIGTFAMANQARFNARDGAGYRWVGDAVLELDGRNPQVAARLLGAFKSWRILEPVRRGHARETLQRIAGHDGLSRDVYEIATKSLQ